MAIYYFVEDITFTLKNKRKISAWLRQSAEEHGATVSGLNIIFCSDAYLLRMNREYLNHDYHTDIITFSYGDKKMLSGDLFISIETIRTNAGFFNVSFDSELHRVIAHGVLHLLGFNDKSDFEQIEMRKNEDLWLQRLQQM